MSQAIPEMRPPLFAFAFGLKFKPEETVNTMQASALKGSENALV
jgi:hypothetical protein